MMIIFLRVQKHVKLNSYKEKIIIKKSKRKLNTEFKTVVISEGQDGMRMGEWGLLKKEVFIRAHIFGILYHTHVILKLFCMYSIFNRNIFKRIH